MLHRTVSICGVAPAPGRAVGRVRRFARPARSLALAAALVLLVPSLALAHLGLRRSTPSNGAHLSAAPRTLRLEFTEAVDVSVARLRLIGPSEREIPLSPLRHPADSARVILADVLGPLEGGVFRLEWQVVGRDGHPVRGTITYVVAPGATGLEDPDRPRLATTDTAAAGADTSAESHHDPVSMPSGGVFGVESPGYVAVRALQYASLLATLGAITFGFVVLGLLRRTEADAVLLASMRTRTARIGGWAALALLVTALLRLYAQSLAMHGADEALTPAYIGAMVAATSWGWAWVAQLVGAVIAIAAFRMAQRERQVGWTLATVAAGLLVVSPALSGHAAAAPRLAPLAIAADALHVLGAAGWLGSLLFVLVAGVPAAMHLDEGRRGTAVARLVHAFSPAALIFAGVTVLTGLFAAWLHVGFSSQLWESEYGRTLLLKLALLVFVFAAGAWNWQRVRPSLGDEAGAGRIRRSATVELVAAALVIIVTAVLVATPPPGDAGTAARTPDARTSTPT